MPKAKANDIEIEYETFGDPSDKPLLLINGLGSQMINWDEGFIQCLVEHGFFVIQFDNRDVGLSTKIEETGEPDMMQAYLAIQAGKPFEPPYTVEDMADDAVGLLDALNIEKAHICGFSMGGTIVQVIAYRHPTRVLSLTSISSSTGNPDIPRGDPEVGRVMATPAPPDRDGYVEYYVKLRRLLNGSIFPYDEVKNRDYAGRAYDRSFYPPGISRQSLALMIGGNRKSKLASITVPTLIIHGADDPIVRVEGGKDTHEAIPGSELIIIEGMGHFIPPETWERISDAIKTNTAKAQA
ncbi:MAG: alpha/beta fold hydrolase [Promethearchaeota archaeon]|jgi:pimeloyl-ACP methyl ester carboxylesterase